MSAPMILSMRTVAAIGTLALAGACAAPPSGAGLALLQASARSDLAKDVVKIRTPEESRQAKERVDTLLLEPLSAEAAVQVALLNNRGLQAAYNDLGISQASFIQASLPPNPRLSFGLLAGTLGEMDFNLVANVLALLTLPARREIAQQQFIQAQYRAVEAT